MASAGELLINHGEDINSRLLQKQRKTGLDLLEGLELSSNLDWMKISVTLALPFKMATAGELLINHWGGYQFHGCFRSSERQD
ncbi:hypothetical protein CEXT_165021 [Caerostris extrusa]|uniref:Uncharacterized protein n=1 Tax=Caerostris extrusa TaxID=172846 RepID=A0AAV4N6F6_CAEEX|nr:hypothetical protein CEXT_165021 [Caerostris extrusa]